MIKSSKKPLACLLPCIALVCCSSANKPDAKEEAWRLTEEPVAPSEKPRPDFNPLQATMRFAPGTFDWQPDGVEVVVHTKLESFEQFTDGTRDLTEVHEFKRDAQRNAGLPITAWLDAYHPILNNSPRKRTWVCLDIEETRFGGAMHFFELDYGADNHPVYRTLHGMSWDVEPDISFHSEASLDQFQLYIRALSADKSLDYEDEDGETWRAPNVREPWFSLAKRCRKTKCHANLHVWAPDKQTFDTLEGYLDFVRPQRPHLYHPKLSFQENKKEKP